MSPSTSLNDLLPAEQVYLEALLEFKEPDWRDWLDRLCNDAPRRPITPIAESGIFPVLSYTNNLFINYAYQNKQLFVDSVFQQFERIEPILTNGVILLELLDVLQLTKPYAYKEQIWVMLSDPQNELRHLQVGGTNIHLQLITLYSVLHDGKRSGEPDLFSVFLAKEAGRHPAKGQFVEASLLHFQRKAPQDYFEFADHLIYHYGTSEYINFWVRAFQMLLRERLPEAYRLNEWFKSLRSRTSSKDESLIKWQNELRLTLSKWIERRQFYRNDPFIVMLYAELIAGLKPPLAHFWGLLCDICPVPEYDDFNKQYLTIVYQLADLSLRCFGIDSVKIIPGLRRPNRRYEYIVFIVDNEDPAIHTHYELKLEDSRFDTNYDIETRQVIKINNFGRLLEIKEVIAEIIDNLLEEHVLIENEPDKRSHLYRAA